MAKRFSDSRKYQDPWFRRLSPKYKLIWDYIIHSCDHAGIWKVDLEMAEFCIGEYSYTVDEILAVCSERVIPINAEKWFIPKFVAFQYGDVMTNKSKACLSAITLMKKERVWQLFTNSLQTDKNKNKDKDKNKDISCTDNIQDYHNIYVKDKLPSLVSAVFGSKGDDNGIQENG